MEFFVIGEEEIVIGFQFIGVQGRIARTREDAVEAFKFAVSGEAQIKVLILTEEVSSMLDELVLEWQLGGEFPLIVEVPGIQGHLEGRKTLIDAIREAIGIHV